MNHACPGEQDKLQESSKNLLSPVLTVKQFCKRYEWPSEYALRAYIRDSDKLGLSAAVLRINRRVLIKPQAFFELLTQLGR